MTELYNAIEFSPVTALANSYNTLTGTTIELVNPAILPQGVPNILTIATDAGDKLVVRYTGVAGSMITGVTVVANTGLVLYPAASIVRRAYTAYEHNAAVGAIRTAEQNIQSLQTSLATTDARLNPVEAKLSGIADGAQVNIIETIKLNGLVVPPVNKAIDLVIRGGSASDTTYDPSASGLQATNVQAAIDEVVTEIPAPQQQSNWTEASTSSPAYIKNKPALGTAASRDIPASGNASSVQVVLGSDSRLGDARTPTPHAATHGIGGDDPLTPSAIGAAAIADVQAVQTNLQGHIANIANPHAVTKAQVGLGAVDNTSDANKPISTATQAALDGKADLVNGKVPSSQLPSYVDVVIEYPSRNQFPETGESGRIYVATDTNLTYRWGGTEYVEISPSLALGETADTAYRGDRGKIAYDHSQTTGNPHQTTKADVGLGNVDNTSDVNKPISTATQSALDAKAGLDVATTSNNGLMSASDKTKLDGVEDGAEVNTIETIMLNGVVVEPVDKVIDLEIQGGGSAADTTYDPSQSGLEATNVQDAIDEIVADIPAPQVRSDWAEPDSAEVSYILNKPTLGTAASKNVPAVGNASTEEVVLGSDTRILQSPTVPEPLQNVALAPEDWIEQTTPDVDEHPFRAAIAYSGITSEYFAAVVFAQSDATGGNFANICQSAADTVYIYAKEQPEEQIIIATVTAIKANT